MTKSGIFLNNKNTNKPGSVCYVKQTETTLNTKPVLGIINLATKFNIDGD